MEILRKNTPFLPKKWNQNGNFTTKLKQQNRLKLLAINYLDVRYFIYPPLIIFFMCDIHNAPLRVFSLPNVQNSHKKNIFIFIY